VNSFTSMAEPKASKNDVTPARPCFTPYHGATVELVSDAQSTSSATASRMAPTSPRPTAS
jgi:hypothetical protein